MSEESEIFHLFRAVLAVLAVLVVLLGRRNGHTNRGGESPWCAFFLLTVAGPVHFGYLFFKQQPSSFLRLTRHRTAFKSAY